MSKGIDIPIDRLVAEFNSDLWNGFNTSFYGRVFRNERVVSLPPKISPEIWTSATDYIEVLKDDRFDAQCFFDVQPNETIEGTIHTAKVWICFMVDLAKLYPTLTRTEATEECHREVEEIIGASQFRIENMVRGFDGFETYDWGENMQSDVDWQPNYLFRFDTELVYVNKNC